MVLAGMLSRVHVDRITAMPHQGGSGASMGTGTGIAGGSSTHCQNSW
jgi:hypothetical protein